MANINEYGFLGDGFGCQLEVEEMDVQQPVAACVIDIQTSESEQEDHGEDIVDDSSVLDSSSDSPAGQVTPSEGPGREYTVGTGPKPPGQVPSDTHFSASISSKHINVGTIATAGVHTTLEAAVPSLLCSVHPTSWQLGCAVCNVVLVHASKAPVYDPKMVVNDRLLGRIAKPPTHAVKLGVVGLKVA